MIELGPPEFAPDPEDERLLKWAFGQLQTMARGLLGRSKGFGKPAIELDIRAGRLHNATIGGVPLLREVRKKVSSAD